jgi:hypothetical protein
VFGSVAGASGLMGAMAGGAGSGGATGSSAEMRGAAGSPLAGTSGVPVSALAPASASRPGGQLTVMVMGSSDAAHWLSQEVLNPYVEAGGTLKSSQSLRSPYSGG